MAIPSTATDRIVGYINVRTRDITERFVIRVVEAIEEEGLSGGGIEIVFEKRPLVKTGDIVIRLAK